MEINSEDISYLLSLPDNILITSVLPTLPVDYINKLCKLNVRVNLLCKNDLLWQYKTLNDFLDEIDNKPNNISWKEFYYSISPEVKIIPIYYHGDIINKIPVFRDDIESINDYLYEYIDNIPNLNIVPINNQLNPINLQENYNDLIKIILIDDIRYNNLDIIPNIEKLRGRIHRNIEPIDFRLQKLDMINKRIISEELTSPLGNLPIYGVTYDYFRIITKIEDLKMITAGGRICITVPKNDLLIILEKLGIDLSYYNISTIKRLELCKIIEDNLRSIGHIINE